MVPADALRIFPEYHPDIVLLDMARCLNGSGSGRGSVFVCGARARSRQPATIPLPLPLPDSL
jgi:hypothetical protein